MITDEVFLEILDTIKKQSTCSYYKTGALIVKDNRIVSMGYNGTPPGFPQCNELQEVLEWLVENPKKALSLINPITDLQLEKLLKNETFKKFPLFSKYSEVRIRPIFSRLVEIIPIILKKLEKDGRIDLYDFNFVHSRYEIHAEQNAIAYSLRAGTNIEGATIYSALLPCMECAKLIVASGIKRVVYIEEYIDKRFNETSRDFLNINEVKVDKVDKIV